ncbi:hypothetical protein LTR62_008312 [Meristemomyces frigidus]|uniref:Large ribosomal subunit protein uL6 alpha-beta domain-containing protein n=1 Tax=Meristemomyces frigidus TaxID=1508187 RepID=A0AAN7TAZ7_9PEZI|nr:hypothetical protein LTR62_008312 [Meristemomyces frigidus]
MAATRCSRSSTSALQAVFNIRRPAISAPPAFLLPAFSNPLQTHTFSTTKPTRSKIGRAPLSLPEDVTFTVTQSPPRGQGSKQTARSQNMSTIDIEGPRGKMSYDIPAYMSIESNDEARTKTLSILNAEDRAQREMWGTARAYLQNHILGVSEGHTAILRLVGVGYRATIESNAVTTSPTYSGQKFVSLKVGYSHPIELGVPQGVVASTPQPTRILLEGVEREVVMQFAAEIRAWRKPEPYKGKGIFVNDETIKLKAKKIK